jgi:short-subunit dehydrogenase
MSSDHYEGTALITGASAGIGAIYADRLARRGYDLILVARSADRLNPLAKRISDETGHSVETMVADLGRRDDLARVEQILRSDASITMLVNNAGIGGVGPLLESDVDRMEETLNVTALTRLTYAAAPGFVARGNGAIINIGSVLGIASEQLNGVYGATKAYVLACTRSLRAELGTKGVRVQAVLPGATATEFWGQAGVPLENLPKEIVMSAADLVDAGLIGFDRGEFATLPALPDAADWDAYEAAREKLLPNLSSATLAARYRRSLILSYEANALAENANCNLRKYAD